MLLKWKEIKLKIPDGEKPPPAKPPSTGTGGGEEA